MVGTKMTSLWIYRIMEDKLAKEQCQLNIGKQIDINLLVDID